jgi:four helix bundle protein
MMLALAGGMKAKTLDDVLVYRKSILAADAVSALIERPALGRDFNLRDQMARSSSRTVALIAEGFGQLTDRHRASFVQLSVLSSQFTDREEYEATDN